MTTSTSFASSLPAAINLVPGSVSLAELRRIHAGGVTLQLDSSALAGMQAAQSVVQRIVDEDQVVYGINTGFGKLASTKIAHDRLAELQRNLVLSHSVGTGDALPDDLAFGNVIQPRHQMAAIGKVEQYGRQQHRDGRAIGAHKVGLVAFDRAIAAQQFHVPLAV